MQNWRRLVATVSTSSIKRGDSPCWELMVQGAEGGGGGGGGGGAGAGGGGGGGGGGGKPLC
jgi:hypothetical protein